MKKLYHATLSRNRNSIIEKGLEPRLSKKFDFDYNDKRIYLYENLKSHVLDFVGYQNVDIWEVELDESYELKDDLIAKEDGIDNCYYVNSAIPPERLKIFKSI